MSHLQKVLDRVRKLLALADNAGSEEEAANAAARAAQLMEEYELTEALVRLDDPGRPSERIVKGRLEVDAEEAVDLDPDAEDDTTVEMRKRVAWRETIALAVAADVGVRTYYWRRKLGGIMRRDMRGLGRESAMQTWRYTYQYLCRAVDELCEKAWNSEEEWSRGVAGARAWKNAFRTACAGRLSERLAEQRAAREGERLARVKAAEPGNKEAMALVLVDRDRDGVEASYNELRKTFTGKGPPAIGQVSSSRGYEAGREAGDKLHLGGSRAGLPAGQGRLTE